jgi:hypothetical protein
MEIEIRLANETDAARWDNLVDESPYGTLFHKWGWLKTAEKYSVKHLFNTVIPTKMHPLMGFSGDKLVAILPLFHYKYLLYEAVSSPPSRVDLPYLGPVIGDNDLKQSKRETLASNFLKEVNTYITSNFKPIFTAITSSPGLFDSRPFSWQGYRIEPGFTYEISLSPDLERIKNNFSKDVRKKMNNARDAGVETSIGDDGVDSVHELLLMRRREQGGAQLSSRMSPKEYIRDICARFSPNNLKIILASSHGEIVGGLIAVNYKDKVQAWFGNPKSQVDGVNELLLWEMMVWSKENGYGRFEIIGADADFPQLCQFKSRFDPYVVPHFSAKRYGLRVFDIIAHIKRQ